MSIKDVEIVKRANIYHEGRVTSRSVITAGGEMKTLGIMLPGTYRFSTRSAETFEVTQGRCRVKAGEHQDWVPYEAGDTFRVSPDSQFEIEVSELFDYVCHYDGEGVTAP